MNILVLDVGTSSMRGTLLDETARTLCTRQVTYQPRFEPRAVEQDPRDWVSALETICGQIAEQEPADALALTAQRSSVIPLDEACAPLTHAIMWQDTRNQALCDSLAGQEERVRQICGTGINTVFSGGKMAWLRQERPEVYRQAAHLCVIPDYLIWQLTGNLVTDHTYGSRSMLMDLREGVWSRALLELFGIDEDKLCRLVPTCSVAGNLTEGFAARTKLKPGIPVITCGGDQQCGALGQGVVAAGSASVNLGTGAFLIGLTDRVPDHLPKGLLCNAAAIPGAYVLETSVLTCGGALDWLLSLLGESVNYVGRALTESPRGASGVQVKPWFQGRSFPRWDSGARATFSGLSLAVTKADLIRGLLEGILLEIADCLRAMEQLQQVSTLCISGGLSGTDGICQLLADVTGKPVVRTGGNATTQGAWMSAAVCLGLCKTWREAWAALPAEQTRFAPDPAAQAFYQAYERG